MGREQRRSGGGSFEWAEEPASSSFSLRVLLQATAGWPALPLTLPRIYLSVACFIAAAAAGLSVAPCRTSGLAAVVVGQQRVPGTRAEGPAAAACMPEGPRELAPSGTRQEEEKDREH